MANFVSELRFRLLVLPLIAGLAACGGTDQCDDGVDNDADGLIDSLDPGCAANGDAEFPEPVQCADGIDNDADGIIDTADPGCQGADDDDEFNEPVAQCKDGIDNDSDGFIDFPNDPGCTLSLDDDESDGCPDGDCPACGNGSDDDEDGLSDYPDDPGCNNAGDDDEFNADPTICGANVPVGLLPASGIAEGTFGTTGSNDLISLDCGGSATEVAFEFTLDSPTALNITTDFPETTTDTVVYVRSECREPATELGCNDDDGGSSASSVLIGTVPAGTYYLIVDSVGTPGNFKVAVSGFSPQGGDCNPMDFDPCPPGLVCRDAGSGTTTCEVPECEDMVDDDGDGDGGGYPTDPGCSAPDDNDESDDCAACPACTACPECANGIDDDSDGLIDEADPGCDPAFAGDNLELECEAETDPVNEVDAASISGDTTGASNDLTPSCGFSTAPELVYTLNVPGELASLQVDTNGSALDTLLYIKADDCASTDLDCDDEGGDSFGDSLITLTDVAPGIYLIAVDGYSSNQGTFNLQVFGEIKPSESCDPAAESAGYLVCAGGFACVGSSGSETCQPAECSDGANNDGDAFTDWPFDPGCSGPSDGTEDSESASCTDPLPKANCPVCSNGIDEDMDGLIDFGEDPGCTGNGDTSEDDECIPGVPAIPLAPPGASGITQPLSAGSNFQGSCNSANSPEDIYVFRVPDTGLTTVTFTTSTMTTADDTVLYVREDTCGDEAAEIACQNQQSGGESVTLVLPNPGAFLYVFVDGDFDSEIAYDLDISGVLNPGSPCLPNFVCPGGAACSGSCP